MVIHAVDASTLVALLATQTTYLSRLINVAVHFLRTVSVRAVLIGQRLNYWMFMFMNFRETGTHVDAQRLTERDPLRLRD